MTFDQLEYFITVINEKSYFNAAETLHISQSSLSKQILKLEQELNISLFDRSHRKSEPTEAGLRFYQEATRLMEQYSIMLSSLNAFRRSNSNVLRIGTLPVLSQYKLGSVFHNFAEKNPDITLQLEEVEEAELATGLEEGRFDFAIMREFLADLHNFHSRTLCTDTLTALLPVNHKFAKRFQESEQPVSLTELSVDSFVLMQKHTSVYQICMQEFIRYHLHPEIIRTARIESILEYVSIGNVNGLLPQRALQVFGCQNVVAVPLVPSVSLNIVLASKKGQKLSAPMSCFIEFIKQSPE